MFNKNIFISHSSANEEIALQLGAFLGRLGIKNNNIFCSSIVGQGVSNGEKLNEKISKAIAKSKLLIFLLSDAFVHSSYCMEELGAGWYLSQQKKAVCFYLVLPDLELSELQGFVNSKIDKFSFIGGDDQNDLGLFAENVCETLKKAMPKHSVESSSEKTFLSATKVFMEKLVENKAKRAEEGKEAAKREEELKKLIGEKDKNIEALKAQQKAEAGQKEKKALQIELNTIVNRFWSMGNTDGITKEIYLSLGKSFWFGMVNRYEDLREKLNYTPRNYNFELLLATVYACNENYEKAYEHFKEYIKINDSSIYEYMIRNFLEVYDGSMSEVIVLLQEKYNAEKEGLVKDSYKDTIKFLQEREKNLK